MSRGQEVAVSAVLGYVAGSIPIGLIVSRLVGGIDIRRFGTGNIGASNVWRHLGIVPAALVGLGTFLQGFLPAWIAGRATGATAPLVAAGAGAVIGYGWSVFLRLEGGSAVGAATGALAATAPQGLIPLLALYALGGLLRQPAIGVLAGLIVFLVFMRLSGQALIPFAGAFIIVLAVIVKRFDGIAGDLRSPSARAVLVHRLLFDRRPGRHLVGPIE